MRKQEEKIRYLPDFAKKYNYPKKFPDNCFSLTTQLHFPQVISEDRENTTSFANFQGGKNQRSRPCVNNPGPLRWGRI